MLKPVGGMLERWRPPERREKDALTELTWGWEDLVGPQIAHNARPIAIAGQTLIIATRSSVWSQQLGFLHEKILAHAAKAGARIEHIRFRVGLLRADQLAGETMPAKRSPRERGSPAALVRLEAPIHPRFSRLSEVGQTELLARLRATFTRIAARRRPCSRCGAPTQGRQCAPCRGAHTQERSLRLERLLYEVPWMTLGRAREEMAGLTEVEYEDARRRLLQRWWKVLQRAKFAGRLSSDGLERQVAMSYVVLHSRLSPDEISPATLRNLLGKELADMLFG